MVVLELPFQPSAPDAILLYPEIDLSLFLEGRLILNADFIEGVNHLQLLLDSPREILTLDITDPLLPFIAFSTPLDTTIHTVAASQGYCDLDASIGQWVGVQDDGVGGMLCVATPCPPTTPDCVPALSAMPVFGTYLEPRVGMSLAYDPRETLTGPLEIRGYVEGPWWPDHVRALSSSDNFIYTQFFDDLSGSQVAEITYGLSPTDGDGWRFPFQPINDEEECTWLRLCYEIEHNGILIYIQDSVKIQDIKEPDITEPAEDGDIVEPETPGTGQIEHPDPSATDSTVVTRREVENPVSDEINGVPQEREGLPVWWYPIYDEEGNEIDRDCIPGGAHCAPTAAIQNILAHAELNTCLCMKLNCYLGNGPDDFCFFDEDEITELILTMGIAMETNKHECGSNYASACKAIMKFLEIICAEAAGCVQCDLNLYCHHVPSGNHGDGLNWAHIVEEMDEKEQSVMLRLTHTNEDGTKADHRVSLARIYRQVGPCVEIEIADPGVGGSYLLTIDTRTVPPTIKDDDYWETITGAIAISDSSEQEEEDRSGNSLDVEYHVWEHVQFEPGASTTFPIQDLTPGFWKYRVRTFFNEDSATAYRQIYVPTPRELMALRVNDDLHLNWNSDPFAVDYMILKADSDGVPFDTLGITVDTFFVTNYTDSDLRLFKVITNFSAP
jgi:hypothetical protein